MSETKKTYVGWKEADYVSKQTEYTEPTPLLDKDGTLLVKGWARHNVFDYDRNDVNKVMRRKEWDFYQISNGEFMVQLSFANISLGGYISACLIDLKKGKTIKNACNFFVAGKDKYVLPPKGDVPNLVDMHVMDAHFIFDTKENSRRLWFKKGKVECEFNMDIMPGLENITTVLPFKGFPDRYFMTTKQNCMPCEGYYKMGDKVFEFSKDDTFCSLDWGRVDTPYKLVWYWGNGSTYLYDEDGTKHIFGFEITWGIGDESNATETCLFYDGKAHKIGAVDVETFPKPNKYMNEWKFVSEDGRFNMKMTPFYDNHGDINALVMRMHSHQVHGIWNGTVTLDDGKVLEIKNMYAFCEYVENRW